MQGVEEYLGTVALIFSWNFGLLAFEGKAINSAYSDLEHVE